MKPIFIFISFLILSLNTIAQSSTDIVTWKFSGANTGKLENKVDLTFNAEIKEGWHLYSQHIEGDGPVPTSFTFNPNDNYTLVGEVEEYNAKKTYDANFDMEISYFEKETYFLQVIDVKNKELKSISGTIEFMVCNDEKCLPPETIDFTIELK